MDNLSFLLPNWYILLCLGFAVLVTVLLYFGKTTSWTNAQKSILSVLRFLALFLISVLLLSPLLKSIETDTKKPVLAVAIDKSSSMVKENGDIKKQKIQNLVDELSVQCKDDYDVVTYFFDANLKDSLDWTFDGASTNISTSIKEINENLSSENLGGIVLISDGIYNQGSNPLYLSENSKSKLFCVGVGDTSIRKDLILRSVISNDVAYLGDKFTTEAQIKSLFCSGQPSHLKTYRIEEGQSILLSDQILNFSKNIDFKTKEVIVNADKPGILHLRYVVTSVEGEQSKKNNSKDVFIEVIDARNKILLIANAPHPDVTAIKSSIETNKNYSVEVAFPNDVPQNIKQYNLVIYHNLPSLRHPITNILASVEKAKLPYWIIAGNGSDLNKLNKIQDISTVKGSWNNPNNAKPLYNSSFTFFELPQENLDAINQFNPLDVPFGNFFSIGNSQVLFHQKIGSVDTEYPLWVFGKSKGIKTSVLYGEGLWRWRLFDYMKNKSFDNFDFLINKSIQYLTVKEDKRKFKVSTSKKIYDENEMIIFSGYLFNESYEKIVDPDINLVVYNSEGDEFKYVFDKNSENYDVNIGKMPAGQYRYLAELNYNGTNLKKEGRFIVKAIQLEAYNLTADFGLLNALSQSSNGVFYTLEESQNLPSALLSNHKIKPTIYESLRTNPVINIKWYFFFIALLLILEWFLRRYFGSY